MTSFDEFKKYISNWCWWGGGKNVSSARAKPILYDLYLIMSGHVYRQRSRLTKSLAACSAGEWLFFGMDISGTQEW